YRDPGHILELDMKFDRELPISTEVTINIDMEEASLDKAANILIEAYRAFKENRCYFEKYGLYLEDEKVRINIMGVTPRDIESEGLLDILKEASKQEDDIIIGEGQDKEEPEGIFVDIMEKED